MAKAKKKTKTVKTAKKTSKPVKKAAVKKAAKAPKKAVAKKATKAAAKKPAKGASTKAAKPAMKKTTIKPAAAVKPSKGRADYADFVTPLDDRVLVRLKGADRMTAGGLFIPDTVSDVSGNFEGTVVAVGRGRRDKKGRVRPMDLRLGDRVVFGQYAGSKIRLMDEELVLLRESEVMGVVS